MIPEVSIKPSRSTHRRRRGARKSEKNKKLQSQNSVENQAETDLAENTMEESVTISTDTATTVSPVEKHAEWEAVPREVIVDPDIIRACKASLGLYFDSEVKALGRTGHKCPAVHSGLSTFVLDQICSDLNRYK